MSLPQRGAPPKASSAVRAGFEGAGPAVSNLDDAIETNPRTARPDLEGMP